MKKQKEVKHKQIVHLRKQEISTETHTYLKQEFSVKLNKPLNPGSSFHWNTKPKTYEAGARGKFLSSDTGKIQKITA